jgi:hypothetical protein
MEPTKSPEIGPISPNLPETITPDTTPETLPASPEKIAPKGEGASQGDNSMPSVQLPKPVAPDPAITKQDASTDSGDSSGNPIIADDVDVLEKEWVDKAKSIVNEHRHDPYIQEDKTSKLQADYLKKRYGKSIKTPD